MYHIDLPAQPLGSEVVVCFFTGYINKTGEIITDPVTIACRSGPLARGKAAPTPSLTWAILVGYALTAARVFAMWVDVTAR